MPVYGMRGDDALARSSVFSGFPVIEVSKPGLEKEFLPSTSSGGINCFGRLLELDDEAVEDDTHAPGDGDTNRDAVEVTRCHAG